MATSTLLLIALGLSLDAFAVAVASGALMRRLHLGRALRMAAFFGGFQALMPIIGWLAGWRLRQYITAFDHWVAFGLLAAIGGKMIFEAFKLESDEGRICGETLSVLLMLAVATSLDALVIGLSFSFLSLAIPLPALIIGVVTFAVTLSGVVIGSRVGHFFERKIEILGGLILIGIGLKILVEHLTAQP